MISGQGKICGPSLLNRSNHASGVPYWRPCVCAQGRHIGLPLQRRPFNPNEPHPYQFQLVYREVVRLALYSYCLGI